MDSRNPKISITDCSLAPVQITGMEGGEEAIPKQSMESVEAQIKVARTFLNAGNTEEAADMFSRLLKLQCGQQTINIRDHIRCPSSVCVCAFTGRKHMERWRLSVPSCIICMGTPYSRCDDANPEASTTRHGETYYTS